MTEVIAVHATGDRAAADSPESWNGESERDALWVSEPVSVLQLTFAWCPAQRISSADTVRHHV